MYICLSYHIWHQSPVITRLCTIYGVKHKYLDLTRLILTILDHYLSISKALDSILNQVEFETWRLGPLGHHGQLMIYNLSDVKNLFG